MHEPAFNPRNVAVVAIGRNEGERMVRCLEAAVAQVGEARAVIYVDSGSTDGSVARAGAMGVTVLELDMSVPFTAARARNLGLEHARTALPDVSFIQFLDADCEMSPGWIAAAVAKLERDSTLAGVAGRLRERFPEATIYNRLCDQEWQAPPGEAAAVGGNAMFRVDALAQVGGYDARLIAGEEPEMCIRLREKGWRLWRLEDPMALHDAAMTRFGQWWRRAVRFGHAQTEVSLMHRNSPKRLWAKEMRSTLLWSLGPPLLSVVLMIGLATTAGGWWWLLGLLPLGLYDLLALRIYLRRRRQGHDREPALLYALFVTLAKFPQLVGMLRYLRNRVLGRRSTLIEYKAPESTVDPARVGG